VTSVASTRVKNELVYVVQTVSLLLSLRFFLADEFLYRFAGLSIAVKILRIKIFIFPSLKSFIHSLNFISCLSIFD